MREELFDTIGFDLLSPSLSRVPISQDLPRIFEIYLTPKNFFRRLPKEFADLDGRIYFDKVRADPLFEEPIDSFHYLNVICAKYAVNILMLGRESKAKIDSKSSFEMRFTMFFDLYLMVNLEKRLRELFYLCSHWPREKDCKCFDFYGSSVLFAMLKFCKEIENRFSWWIFLISVMKINLNMIDEAVDLKFGDWINKVSVLKEFFSGVGDINFPEIVSGDYNLKAELNRVIGGLRYECDEMAASLAKAEPSKPGGGDEMAASLAKVKPSKPGGGDEMTNKQPTTLENFIKEFCDLSQKPVVDSKVKLLFKYNREKSITFTLPPLAIPWRTGQYKIFYAEDLTGNWRDYQKIIPTLPPLKS